MPFDVEMCEKCGRCVALAECEYHRPQAQESKRAGYVALDGSHLNWAANPGLAQQMAAMNQARTQRQARGFKIRWTALRDYTSFGVKTAKGDSGWFGADPNGEIFATRADAEIQKAKSESMYSSETAYEIFQV